MLNIKAHVNNIALWHTIFDLPFAFMAAFLANNNVDGWTLFFIAAAVTLARAAALAIDNLADLKYDKLQPRLSYRAMVKGQITKTEAMIFIIMCLVLCVVCVAQLRPICLKLLPIAVIPFIIYPFTKRFTGWCHLFLGFAIAMAPAGGWIAAGGEIDLPMILLCLAVALWIGAFDAIYGAQDINFDRSQRLHSLATEFGAAGAFKIANFLHVISIVCFTTLGLILHLNFYYYIGVLIAALTLIYQHSIVSPTDFSRINQTYFLRNSIVSCAIVLLTLVSL